ncbi:MAG: hypothetical protein PW734_00760 [Verrucomicrobium sp.]|nr:hypothetical protein [Verrucomicrobium sp.]
MPRILFLPVLGWSLALAPAAPSLVFSANDQASGYRDARMFVAAPAGPGSVTAADFSTLPPRTWTLEGVPCSVIGPPTCIAATRDGGTVLVAGAMAPDASQPKGLRVDRRLTRLAWTPGGLRQVAQAEIGLQPSGVSLSPDGERAYVTLRGEGKLATIDLRGGGLKIAALLPLATKEESLSHFALSPDGTRALASLHDGGAVLACAVTPEGVRQTQRLPVGKGPYDVEFFADGRRALAADNYGDALFLLAERDGTWSVAQRLPVGRNPEGIAVSPDQSWVAIACFDGANAETGSPWYGEPSRVYLFRPGAHGRLAQQGALEIPCMPQGCAFTPDGRYLAVSQYGLKTLRVFKLEEGRWIDADAGVSLSGDSAALVRAGR